MNSSRIPDDTHRSSGSLLSIFTAPILLATKGQTGRDVTGECQTARHPVKMSEQATTIQP